MLRTDFPLPSRGPIRPREAAITEDGIVTLGEAAIWMAREPAQEYPIVGECNGVRCRFTHARCTDDAGRPAFVTVVRYRGTSSIQAAPLRKLRA